MFRKGNTVSTWFDTGAGKMGGPQILYGVVIRSGPKVAVIEWPNGSRNRVSHQDRRVAIELDTQAAREYLERMAPQLLAHHDYFVS